MLSSNDQIKFGHCYKADQGRQSIMILGEVYCEEAGFMIMDVFSLLDGYRTGFSRNYIRTMYSEI